MASKTREGAASAAPSLSELAGQIRACMAQADLTALSLAREVGGLLREAKERVTKGKWRNWLEKNFPQHPTYANLYMRIADPANEDRVSSCRSVADAKAALADPKKVAARAKNSEPRTPTKAKPTPAGKRMRAARMARADAKRNGRPVPFWEIGWEVSKMVYGLASWKVEDVPLDYDNMNAMATVEEDLLYLYDWMDETLALIHSRMGEHGMRQQLRKLQARTVANGCTPEEAANAARAAGRLQRKIDNVLEAAS